MVQDTFNYEPITATEERHAVIILAKFYRNMSYAREYFNTTRFQLMLPAEEHITIETIEFYINWYLRMGYMERLIDGSEWLRLTNTVIPLLEALA